MGPYRVSGYLKVALLALFLTLLPLLAVGGEDKGDKPGKPDPVPWTGPVPKAHCGPNDRTESGLQGQTTPFERTSGLSELGFNCNLELVGQFQGEGSKSWHMAWFDDCAYYGTNKNPLQQHLGVAVVDASDPRNPKASAYLDTPTMLDPHESLKEHKGRKLLAGVQNTSFTNPLPPAAGFAIYDVSADCRHPVLQASISIPGSVGHAGNFTPDGMTYYGTHTTRIGLTAIDISDPTQPKLLGFIEQLVHDISFSKDGTRAYIAQIGRFFTFSPLLGGPNGLAILDVSDFQFRRPNPQARVISRLYWEDGSGAQQTLPVTYHGRPYLIFTDENGSFGFGPTSRVDACAQGLPPHGFARIIDITDETNPEIVAKLMLEVHDPANCPVTLNDLPDPGSSLAYAAHYCNVDRVKNPTMLACTYQQAGLRVFDIRDPFHPREIAYYKPPARRMAFLPGSNFWAAGRDRTVEHTASRVRFRKHKGEIELWFNSADNAFQIVRFTNHLKEIGKDFDDGGGRDRDGSVDND